MVDGVIFTRTLRHSSFDEYLSAHGGITAPLPPEPEQTEPRYAEAQGHVPQTHITIAYPMEEHSSFDDYLSVNLPIVVVDRRVETTNRNVGKLFVDTFHASRQATEHLIARGCRRIGFVGAANDYDDVRYLGYCSALEEAGLRVEDALCYKNDYSVETGHRGMKAIISAGMPDGVFCGNDLIAVGAMAEIHSMGFTIPTDVRVVGFDDIYLSRYLRPALTTVRQPAYDMGFEAAKMLISHITEGTPLCTLKMKHELIIREST